MQQIQCPVTLFCGGAPSLRGAGVPASSPLCSCWEPTAGGAGGQGMGGTDRKEPPRCEPLAWVHSVRRGACCGTFSSPFPHRAHPPAGPREAGHLCQGHIAAMPPVLCAQPGGCPSVVGWGPCSVSHSHASPMCARPREGLARATERGQGCSLHGPFLWGGDLALSPSWVWA